MYSVKPYLDLNMKLNLPNCMYKVEPMFQLDQASEPTCSSAEDTNPELEKLAKRQDSILARLEILKKEIEELGETFSTKPVSCVPETEVDKKTFTCNAQKQVTGNLSHAPQGTSIKVEIEDLVVRCPVAQPPVSLFILQSFLSAQFPVHCSSFVHSSVKNIPLNLKNLFGERHAVNLGRSLNKYEFTFIWDDRRPTPSLILSPTRDVVITGEYNIARYLARLLSTSFDSLDSAVVAQIDDSIDMAVSFKNTGSPSINEIVDTLDSRLSKSAWIAGKEFTIADIVVWSLLYSEKKSADKLSKNVKRWFVKCSNMPEFGNLP